MDDIMDKSEIKRLALENALRFSGTASEKAIFGAVMKDPDARKNIAETRRLIEQTVKEVNSISYESQKEELLKINPGFFDNEKRKRKQNKRERNELPPLPNAVEGEVVTRMPPEPSKYNHLGHAMSFLINYLYAKKYNGKCILRFDDTNPEKEKQEFVDAMREDVLEYLGITPDEIIFASDFIPRMYSVVEDLINRGLAYTDDSPRERMAEQRRKKLPSPNRDKDKIIVLGEWKAMLAGDFDEGDLVVRLKIDYAHKNAVMRDPVIMRIVKTPHYRQGTSYNVWPMYDFENALLDSWNGVTHVLRSNEFDTRIELHNYIKDLLGISKQTFIHYGRYSVVGLTSQGREIRDLIDSGKMMGWDDPRLLTLRALKRRGIVKESFYELVRRIGLSKTQTNLDFGVIAAINRKILDEEANRYFFIHDPIEIVVDDWPDDLPCVELKLHPYKQRGGRTLELDGHFFISEKDYNKINNGMVFRLIDTINLVREGDRFKVHSRSVEEYRSLPKEKRYGLIHFLPKNESLVNARMLGADAEYIEGFCEPGIRQLREGAHIQFERVCFARLDSIDDKYFTFWYSHE